MADDTITHGEYLITVESSKFGHVAWMARADGDIVRRYDGSAGLKIGTRTYMERDHAIQAAKQAVDDGEVA
jgi:hypothetical protein